MTLKLSSEDQPKAPHCVRFLDSPASDSRHCSLPVVGHGDDAILGVIGAGAYELTIRRMLPKA
jgi:hypothetical protein